jgi:hypothetical protein
MRRTIILAFATLAITSIAFAECTKRVLFLGNSYTYYTICRTSSRRGGARCVTSAGDAGHLTAFLARR